MATASDVLDGNARWSCECADVLVWLAALPDDSIDLLVTSPPYMAARTYGRTDVSRDLDSWVAWTLEVVRAAAPKVRGLIAINCEGQTRDYRYLPAPFLLAADLHRAGFNLRKPPIFHRVGIPGSGGPDWLRNDYEPIICVTRPGRLPWSDNTACGHPPKWAPGGEMSNRTTEGTRVNQWGHSLDSGATVVDDGGVVRSKGKRPSHKNAFGVRTDAPVGTRKTGNKGEHETYRANDKEVPAWLRDGMHTGVQSKIKLPKRKNFSNDENGEVKGAHEQDICAIANPGNRIEATYTASEVAELLGEVNDMLELNVGGGVMGHALAHDNEAPFPLDLPAFFIKSFAPPDGVVCDPFSGSGTTCHAAFENNRRFIGCDIRESQVKLCERRLATVTPSMFGATA